MTWYTLILFWCMFVSYWKVFFGLKRKKKENTSWTKPLRISSETLKTWWIFFWWIFCFVSIVKYIGMKIKPINKVSAIVASIRNGKTELKNNETWKLEMLSSFYLSCPYTTRNLTEVFFIFLHVKLCTNLHKCTESRNKSCGDWWLFCKHTSS